VELDHHWKVSLAVAQDDNGVAVANVFESPHKAQNDKQKAAMKKRKLVKGAGADDNYTCVLDMSAVTRENRGGYVIKLMHLFVV
jgi:hypothetical protein